MHKIPTLFQRDENHKVINKVTPGCEWVLAGKGVATEKLDGTNVRLTVRSGEVVRVEKRRNPSKEQKARGIVDGWYVDAHVSDPADQHIFGAIGYTDTSPDQDSEFICEAIGPKIQGNPLGLEFPWCKSLADVPIYACAPRSYDELKLFLAEMDSILSPGHLAEGIVFHHHNGRMAKIKRKDFPS